MTHGGNETRGLISGSPKARNKRNAACWEAIDDACPGERAILVGCSIGSSMLVWMQTQLRNSSRQNSKDQANGTSPRRCGGRHLVTTYIAPYMVDGQLRNAKEWGQ